MRPKAISLRLLACSSQIVGKRDTQKLLNVPLQLGACSLPQAYQLSVIHLGVLGSTLSVRQFVRTGGRCSACCRGAFGSSLSVRDFVRCGSCVSLFRQGASAKIHVGGSLSLLGAMQGGSALSVRNFIRGATGGGSVTTMCMIGSSFSLRSFARLGSRLSVNAGCRTDVAYQTSVLDHLAIGSCLSVRGYVKTGHRLSTTQMTAGGSSLSIRSRVRGFERADQRL